MTILEPYCLVQLGEIGHSVLAGPSVDTPVKVSEPPKQALQYLFDWPGALLEED